MDPIAAAKAYVKEKLAVDFVDDKSELQLNKIVRAFFEKVPYQNISTSILPADERFPSASDVVQYGTILKGGLGVHNNWFFKMLLEALGYNVDFLAAKVVTPPSGKPRKFGGHFGILVKDLNNPGDLHLVDVGSGYPVFKAVPLNELPYTATDVVLTYRFIEEGDQWHSEHKSTDGDDNWTRFLSYEKTPVKGDPAEVFKEPVQHLLQEAWLVGRITAVFYPQPGSPALPDAKKFNKNCDWLVHIDEDKITFANSQGDAWEEELSDEEIVSTFQTYFPTIPKQDVERIVELLE